MSSWRSMPAAGLVVVGIIVVLFIIAVIMLFHVCSRYRRVVRQIDKKQSSDYLHSVGESFAAAYKDYGEDINTPAIIENAVNTEFSGLLFCERFLNNAVSLFVTLGLFGTFLGLSLSVSSLTELISYSNTSEWLSVLDSVGGGLMSALSGMGVAFYTSLVGVACSIILTILRSICSPQAEREKLETALELWLDHNVAPTLPNSNSSDEVTQLRRLIATLEQTGTAVETALTKSTEGLLAATDANRQQLAKFDKTVGSFNEGVHDFSEFNYNLRGTVERMDVCIRDLVAALRAAERKADK